MKPFAAAAGIALLVSGSPLAADEPQFKPAIRGLVSMGAYRFVGAGGDPVTRSSRCAPSRESSADSW